jgi:menaquinone-dependent protoporphyrinogen oxidase
MEQAKMSQRKFLILTGGAIGGLTMAYAGLNTSGSIQTEIKFPEISLGEQSMNNQKILVAYASQAGSTAEIAEAIGLTLSNLGEQVEVCRMKNVLDLTPYKSVVAGSAIQGTKWLPEGMEFLRTHQRSLAQKPFAAFLACITLGMSNASNYHEGIKSWMEPVRSLVKPCSEGYFAGALDFAKLPLTFNILMLRAAVGFGALPKGDHRDWNAINSWATSLAPLIK